MGQPCFSHGQSCPSGHQHVKGQLCPLVGHRHLIGQPCPLVGQGVTYRLGTGSERGPCPLKVRSNQAEAAPLPMGAMPPVPVGMQQQMSAVPPPYGVFGGAFMPRQYQYQQMQPPAGYGYAQGGYPGTVGYGNVQGHGYGYPVPAQERIVYVPYAAPPPIHVERLGKALPIPRPPIMRRILGDAYMYEYPEMPLHLYTTRGPRDFFAPNPPSIGE